MKEAKHRTVYRGLSELKKLHNNPRTITKADLEKLKESIQKNPDYFEARPIILSNRTGELMIIAGNQRYEAAKALGLSEVPTVLLEGLTKEREEEIIIRDNVSNGEWDMDLLSALWDPEKLLNWGAKIDWQKLDAKKEIKEDSVPEPPEEPKTKPGDIFQLGGHKLMCGDSTDPETMERLMDGEKADLYLTDPPYNVAYTGKTKDALTIQNDKMDNSVFRQFLNDAFFSAVSVMKKGAAFYVWHADSEGYNFRGACEESGLEVKECLVWNKNTMVLGRQDYQWKHEPCLYGWKKGAPHKWYSDRKQTTVLEFDKPSASRDHPTMKPVALFAYQIQNSTKPGDIVLDSFGGSGTTIMACEQLGRKGYVVELDPKYCDVIIKRWEQFTGDKAVKC